MALLGEHRVHWVLVETVDKLDKVVLEEAEFLKDSDLEGVETLLHQHFFTILGSQSEDVNDDAPARLDVGSLGAADISDAHDDVLFDVCSCRQIVKHDLLKRHQEVFLEVKAREFILDEELVGKLSQRVNSKDCNVEVLMWSYMDEMLAKHLPNSGPDKPDAGHIKVCDFYKSLQAEFAWVNRVSKLFSWYSAKALDELDDSVLVKIEAALEDLINLSHLNVLYDHLTVSNAILLAHRPVGFRLLWTFLVRLRRVSFKEVAVSELALTYIDHFLELRYAIEHEIPALT